MSPDSVRAPDNHVGGFAVEIRMPWSLTNPSKERVKFALEWEKRWDAGEGRMNLSELCREFGISRETGYVWLRRYPPREPALRQRPPFASTGAGGLTSLAVWWWRLGIRHDRITPGKPQENGRLERFHRTLAELVEEPEADMRAQQRAFDRFRHEYNNVRPHEALKLKPPLSAYEPSPRRYPRKLDEFQYPGAYRVERIDMKGNVRWGDRRVFVSTALAHEYVSIDQDAGQDDDHRWEVRWGEQRLGWLDDRKLDRGLILPARPRR